MAAGGGYTIDRSISIARPASRVYAFLADIQESIPRGAHVTMIKEPTGPTAAGTRWHERVRFVPGVWLSVVSTVTEAEEPHRLAMEFASRLWSGRLDYEIRATREGSVLRHHEVLRPCRLLRPLTSVIGRRLDRAIEERLVDIRDAISEPDTSSGLPPR